VGFYATNGMTQTLTEHWDGSTWTVVPSPDPGSANNELRSVRGTSPSDVWAVGASYNGTTDKTLTMHWNGHTWAQVATPSPGTSADVIGVRGTSSTDYWAVGDTTVGGVSQTLALHRNGQKWARVATPDPGGPTVGSFLIGVAGTSATDTWAVGGTADGTLILHWDGSHWTQVPSPNPGASDGLNAVAASAPSNVWAVGRFNATGVNQTLAIHCC
jgi:hypothetical protein